MRPDYTDFDKELLAGIACGCDTMAMLDGRMRALAEPFARTSNNPTYRIVDRRLQALRKAGKIRFNNKTWELA